jgi:hypothetical protein
MLTKSILSYQGPLSFSTIDSLLSEFKMAAQDHELSFKTYKKMISVMIEALENVSKYSDQFKCNGDQFSGFCPSCQISRSDSVIEMETKNPVKKGHVTPLRSRIDNVNNQDREALKALYKATITNGKFTAKGGAGLGFIEMAKTTGHKLEYNFEKLTKDYALYTFRVSMDI